MIGYLHSTSPDENPSYVAGYRQGLSEIGYVEGRNVAIEYRSAQGRYDRLPALASDLAHREVAVIFATGAGVSALAAKSVTSTIPIVFATEVDPVGLVASFNRPGGNVTGVFLFTSVLVAKRLELLAELVPNAAVIAMLVNLNSASAESDTKEVEQAARTLGRQIEVIGASTESDIDMAFATLVEHRAAALLVVADPFFSSRRAQLVALAARYAVPASYPSRSYVEAGGLFCYGHSLEEAHRQAGVYTGRILKGAKPSDLPVEQPTKFELVLNAKTARALGLTIPPLVLARADEAIE